MRRITLLLAVFLAIPAFSQTKLTGAGATFPNPIYQKWFSEYGKAHSDVQINYQSIGSGGGIRPGSQGTLDFGASHGPMSDEQLSAAQTQILPFPSPLPSLVPPHHLPRTPSP